MFVVFVHSVCKIEKIIYPFSFDRISFLISMHFKITISLESFRPGNYFGGILKGWIMILYFCR